MTAPVSELLSNYLGGQWRIGTGKGTALLDPVTGTELVRVDATGLDLAAGFAFAREQGGAALRALSYQQRGALLGAVLLALIETFVSGYLSTQYRDLFAFIILIGMLVVRPSGIMGKDAEDKA